MIPSASAEFFGAMGFRLVVSSKGASEIRQRRDNSDAIAQWVGPSFDELQAFSKGQRSAMSERATPDLNWIFDPKPPSGIQTGGSVLDQIFDRDIDFFVRETTQNANDQRVDGSQEPVELEFHIHTVNGPFLEQFFELIGWPQLKEHLEALEKTRSLRAERYKKSLVAAKRQGARFLVVSDFNTKGLIGSESGIDGNFALLVKHSLVTNDEKTVGGGSYGIGKSVLWAFSDISTALFCSRPLFLDPKEKEGLQRFIGRSILSSHVIGAVSHEGNGLFGSRQKRDGGDFAESVWLSSDEKLLQGGIFPDRRSDGRTGTSILIPFFAAPGSESEESPRQLSDSIVRSLNLWFWPIIGKGDLLARVRHSENGSLEFESTANGQDGVEPFVRACSTPTDQLKSKAEHDDDVAERSVRIRIPGKRTGELEVEGETRLRVLREDDKVENASRVALIRGAGMVVKYLRPPALAADLPDFFAVLEAGKRVSQSEIDLAVEDFFRAAEPIAHNDWLPNTDRMQRDYKSGAKSRIDEFRLAISTQLRECLQLEAKDEEEGPEALSRAFSLGGEDVEKSCYLRISDIAKGSELGSWSVTATASVDAVRAKVGWRLVGELGLASEFGAAIKFKLAAVELLSGQFSGCSISTTSENSFTIVIAPNIKEIKFKVLGLMQDNIFDHEYIDRAEVQLSAIASTTGAQE